MYVQSLKGILEIHEKGVNETNFHEVNSFLPVRAFFAKQCHVAVTLYKAFEYSIEKRNASNILLSYC